MRGLWQHSGNHAWKMPAHPICTHWLRDGVVLHPPLLGAVPCSVVSAACDDMQLVLPAHQFDQEVTLLLLPLRSCLHPSGPAHVPALPKRAGKQALRSQHHLKKPRDLFISHMVLLLTTERTLELQAAGRVCRVLPAATVGTWAGISVL